MALPGQVSVQRFTNPDQRGQRRQYWDAFQISLHEYMHTLEHDVYHRYALTKGQDSEAYNTLVEGAAYVLAETVWPRVATRAADPAIRQ